MTYPSLATSARTAPAPKPSLDELPEYRHLYVAANRGPVHYRLHEDKIVPAQAAGGLVTALSGLAHRAPITWIATASGPADRLMASRPSSTQAAPGLPRLRFVIPSEEALNWFYRRFSNPILWFLQHGLWGQLRRPDLAAIIERGWVLGYRPVNEAFAQALEREIYGIPEPVVLVHDYHLYLVPARLRRSAPRARIQHFTHIPWPGPEAWEPLLPAIRRQLCKGLLGADVVGFQTWASAANFLRCCERFVPGVWVDYAGSTVWLEERSTRVRAYPISVDPGALHRLASAPETLAHQERLACGAGQKTIVRVDRLDPSKNVALGFRAYGRLLERRPDLVGRVRFLAFLVPSRDSIAEYRLYAQEVRREVEAVNERFGHEGWTPIQVFYEDNRAQAMAGMAIADVLLVNPLADGMNLVAKEGPMVSQRDLVLVLSRHCGAHVQLGQAALSISPRDLEETAAALELALELPWAERRRRARALRAAIESQDLQWWMKKQMDDLLG